MSNSLYPQGMKTYNNHLPQGGYKSWKPQTFRGVSATQIRPYANKVPNIVILAPFGKPRPLKQYRKGIVPPGSDPYFVVKSTQSQSINGGLSLMGQMNTPGGYQLNQTCSSNCHGIHIVDINPIVNDNLTDNPSIITTTKEFCCNAQKDALRGVIYASQSYQNPNYYTSYTQYMQNKCETYEQRVGNFVGPAVLCDPYSNSYIIDCQPVNRKACSAIYKPNNRGFLVQGAVSGSTRTLRASTDALRCPGVDIPVVDNKTFQNKKCCII
jgi:hypothetical protein